LISAKKKITFETLM